MTLFGCTWMGKRIVEIVKPAGFVSQFVSSAFTSSGTVRRG
jgi:hypothetical protein